MITIWRYVNYADIADYLLHGWADPKPLPRHLGLYGVTMIYTGGGIGP